MEPFLVRQLDAADLARIPDQFRDDGTRKQLVEVPLPEYEGLVEGHYIGPAFADVRDHDLQRNAAILELSKGEHLVRVVRREPGEFLDGLVQPLHRRRLLFRVDGVFRVLEPAADAEAVLGYLNHGDAEQPPDAGSESSEDEAGDAEKHAKRGQLPREQRPGAGPQPRPGTHDPAPQGGEEQPGQGTVEPPFPDTGHGAVLHDLQGEAQISGDPPQDRSRFPVYGLELL